MFRFSSWLRQLARGLFAPTGPRVRGRRVRPRHKLRAGMPLKVERVEERWLPSLTTLATFNGTNGLNPEATLFRDSSGNLFGTTYAGGASSDGTVFEVQAGSGTVTTLASFSGTNGANPQSGLVEDSSGNLFGTTLNGGASGYGTVFEWVKSSGSITVLASFNNTANGANPAAGVIEDSNGNLFGTTSGGGPSGYGTVFEWVKSSGTITVLASFNAINGLDSQAGLVEDSSGNLFGTTSGPGDGSVFEVMHGSSTITTLATFNGTNGDNPEAGLVEDSSGNFFGTTFQGGTSGDGNVFELANGSHTITTLASFNYSNGDEPEAGLVEDSSGNLFGTTFQGGTISDGTVFEVQAGSGAITTLATFNGTNGDNPEAGLVEDSSGNLFGTTFQGGTSGDGNVFEYSPPTYGVNLNNGVLTISQGSAGNDNLNFSLSGGTYTFTDTGGLTFGTPTGNDAGDVHGAQSSTITVASADVSSIAVTLGTGTNTFNLTGSGGAAIAPIALNAGASGSVTFSGSVTLGSGSSETAASATINSGVTVQGAGTVTANLTDSGTLDLDGSGVSVVGAFTGSGIVTNSAASGTATLTINGTGTFGGVIQNGSTAHVALTVAGGTVTLSGTNTYTGTTTVNGGTLALSGSLASTSIVVNTGGALKFTVINTNTSGAGSLAQAITTTDDTSGVTPTIQFAIGTTGSSQMIVPTAAEPTITAPVIIDAFTQGGSSYSGTPLIDLSGTSAGAGAFGFTITGSQTTIEGFLINNFTGTSAGGSVGTGIVVSTTGATGNLITGNWIGTNGTGMAAAANGFGISVVKGADNNTIGGTLSVVSGKLSGAGNLVSGNTDDGVYIASQGGFAVTGTLVEGNFIGTDITGTLALANGGYGVHLNINANSNIIGGSSSVNSSTGDLSGAGNVISGNTEGGLVLTTSTGNAVEGNFIGTNVSGTADIANNPTGSSATGYEDDVDLLSSSNNNTIGGVSTVDSHGKLSGLGNLISGSGYQGIYLNASTGNLIEGNYIGTDPSGTYGLSNSYSGIYLDTGSASNTIGGTSAVSTTASFTGNLASCNANYGIAINGSGSSGNLIEGNDVGTNAAGNAVLTTTAYAFGGGTVTLPIPQLSTTAGASTTVSFWMKWDGSTNGGNGEIPISFTGTTGYSLYLYNGFFGFNVNSEVYGVTDPSGFANQWHFISAIFTNGAENATNDQLYIDGVKQTLSIKVGSATSGKVGTTAYLGNYQTTTTYRFSGDLAQVAFFNGKLSAATIQTYYAAAASTTYWDDVYGTAVAYYPLTETGGTVAVDLSGNSNNGSLSSTGVTPAGSAGPLTAANGFYGVYVASGASGNTIGGSSSVSGGQLSGPGNLVSGNAEGGIVLNGTSSAPVQNNLIAGNFTGTNVTGNAAIPNDPTQTSEDDVDLLNYSSDNTVGGVSSRDGNNNLSGLGNLISGSGEDGIYVAAGASANLIEGNFIGTDKTGMASVGNDYQGVGIDSASNNTLGGTATGTGNVISGGDELGVAIFGSGGGSSSNNLILGNNIGLAADGSTALGNAYSGIYLGTGSDFGETAGTATNNTIGGTTSAAYNVIASNGNYGVWLTGSTTGDVIQGNDIGYMSSLASSPNAEGDLQVDSGGTGSNTGGTLTLGSMTDAGTFTLSGTTVINSALTISSGGVLNWDSANITARSGTGTITDNGSLVFNSASSFTVGNVISGTGTLTQQGSGDVTLSSSNTYSGATTLTAGTLTVGAGTSALGSGNLNLNGGTLTASVIANVPNNFVVGGAATVGGGTNMTLSGNGTLSSALTVTDTGTVFMTGVLSSAGTLTVNAPGGTLVLSNANTYSGATTISAGTLQIGSGGSTGTLGTANVSDNGTLAFNRNNSLSVSNVISGTGAVSQIGSGTLTLTATNTYSGGTTLASGTLVTASTNAVQTITFGGTITGGTFSLTFNGRTTTSIAYPTNAVTLQTALGALSNIGAGNVTVSGSSPYTVTFVNNEKNKS
jgi:fibronectin-binding autotransporter adhesin